MAGLFKTPRLRDRPAEAAQRDQATPGGYGRAETPTRVPLPSYRSAATALGAAGGNMPDSRLYTRLSQSPRLAAVAHDAGVQLAQADPSGRPSRNNDLVKGWGDSIDRTQWNFVQLLDESQSTFTFESGDRISIEASSLAYPPTNQFYFTVHAQPLNADGSPQESIGTADWFAPVEYSSGFTGAGSPNQFVIQARSSAPKQRWTITIPPQQAAHDNALYNTLRVYAGGEQ
jgi:hypothetical protein